MHHAKRFLLYILYIFKIPYLIRLEKEHPEHKVFAILIAAIAIYYTA